MNFNELSKQIFEQNKAAGWWDDMDRCPYTTLQLVSTEIAEATEGERKDLMDDHLPHRKMGEVELADALIRVLDFGGRYELNFSDSESRFVSDVLQWPAAKWHYHLNNYLFIFGNEIISDIEAYGETSIHYGSYSDLITAAMQAGESLGYDIEGALHEKLEYNKTRADHKRENRAKQDGKKF